MNILTFVPVITSGAAWSGAGGQLRLGGCCHEAPALSVTSWESSAGAIRVPGTGRPATRPAGDRETRRERGGHLGGAQEHLCRHPGSHQRPASS